MFNSYDYWSNIFSSNRYYTLPDWNIAAPANHPKLEGYIVFHPVYNSITDCLQIAGIPSFCSASFLTIPPATIKQYQFACSLYVLHGERQLRTKKDFSYLNNALSSGHIVKVRTSTDRLYYLHTNFILDENKKVLVMPYSLYFHNNTTYAGYNHVDRQLYINPVLMSYKNDFIKKMVVHDLLESLSLFNFSVCIRPMETSLAKFCDIYRAGFSLDLEYYHDRLSNILINQSFRNSVIDNL